MTPYKCKACDAPAEFDHEKKMIRRSCTCPPNTIVVAVMKAHATGRTRMLGDGNQQLQ